MTPSALISAAPQGAYLTWLLTQLLHEISISLCPLVTPPGYAECCVCICLWSGLLSLRATCRSHCHHNFAYQERRNIVWSEIQYSQKLGAFFTHVFIHFYYRTSLGNTIACPICWIIFNIIPGIWNYLVILSWFLWFSMSWAHTAYLNTFMRAK